MLHLLKKPVRPTWYVLAAILVITAIVVQAGRLLAPQAKRFHSQIESTLSARINADVSIGDLEFQWNGLSPEVFITDLSVTSQEQERLVSIGSAHLELDVLSSLYQWFPVWRELQAEKVDVVVRQTETGGWTVGDFQPRNSGQSSWRYESPGSIFLLAHYVNLAEARIRLSFFNGRQMSAVLPEIKIENSGHFHRLDAKADVAGRSVFRFVLEGVGDPAKPDSFFAKAYMTLDDFPLERLAKAWSGVEPGLKDVTPTDTGVDMHLWFDFAGPSRFYINGDIDWKVDPQSDFAKSHYLDIPFEAKLFGDYSLASGLSLNFSGIQIDGDMDIKAAQLRLKDERLDIGLPYVNLAQWHQWTSSRIRHGQKIQNIIDTLSPTGEVQNAWLYLDLNDPEKTTFEAELENVAVKPWKGVPGFEGVNGFVSGKPMDGQVLLETDNFSIWPQEIYTSPITYDSANAIVQWSVSRKNKTVDVNGRNMFLTGKYGQVSGHFQLHTLWNPQPGDTLLDLQLGVRNTPMNLHKDFVPNTLPRDFLNWLDSSITDGVINQGGFIYRGTVDNNALGRSVQLFAEVESAELNLSEDWPPLKAINGNVMLDSDYLVSDVSQATVYGDEVIKAQAIWREKQQAVFVDGTVQTTLPGLLRYTKDSWLHTLVGDSIDMWTGAGRADLELSLVVPLDNKTTLPKQHVEALLDGASLRLEEADLPFNNIRGRVGYDSATGFFSSDLKANILDGEFAGKIGGGTGGAAAFSLSGHGRVNPSKVARWLNEEALFAPVEGEAEYSADLLVPTSESAPTTLLLFSDLAQVALNYPAPLFKPKGFPVPMAVVAEFGKTDQSYSVRVGNRMDFHSRYQGEKWISSYMGVSDKALPSFSEVPTKGSLYVGKFSQLNIKPWLEFINKIESETPSEDDGKIDIFIESELVYYDEYTFENWLVSGQREDEGWSFILDSDDILGALYIDDDDTTPWLVDIDYLNWPPQDGSAKDTAVEIAYPSFWENFDAEDISNMDVSIGRLIYEEKDIGQWQFKFRVNPLGVDFVDIQGSSGSFTFSGITESAGGKLAWLKGTDELPASTKLRGRLQGEDFSELTDAWEFPRFVENESSVIDAVLDWKGSPEDFDLATTKGHLSLDFTKGYFNQENLDDAAEILQLLSLLNFDTWIRWARLDFSSVSKRGMAFDQFGGDMALDAGRISFVEPLKMSGPTSKMQLTGFIDYPTQTVNTSLTATVPVGGNLTILTALAAGLPAAAGVYIVTKLLNKQIDQASSITYDITGDWANPNVQVRRLDKDQPPESAPEN